MEAGVEIRGEEIVARKTAAETAIQDSQPAKKAATSGPGDIDSTKERPTFRCLPDKKREWSRLEHTGTAKFAPKKGWSWRYTMWRHDILYMRNDEVVTALTADLGATSHTIFQRLYSQVSQDPWTVHWAIFERKATCRFDCAPPDLDLIPVGTFFQTYSDDETRLVSKLYTFPPGEARRAVRTLEKGEIIGPTVGPAVRCETIYGDFVS
eukprot:1243722-Pyramimonas_sp.AAC.1